MEALVKPPEALRLSEASSRYAFHRRYLQGLLIAGELEGFKNVWGFWYVTVRAMERLSQERTLRKRTQDSSQKEKL